MQKLAGIITEGENQYTQKSTRLKKSKFIAEAKKKKSKKEEEPEEMPAEDIVDDTTNVDLTFDDAGMEPSGDMMTPGTGDAKKVFGKLTDAFEAAKEFGDEKLIQQVANTIKYFNDNVILNTNS